MDFVSPAEAAQFFVTQNVISAVFSKTRRKQNPYTKIKFKKIIIKNTQYYQIEYFESSKVFHKNIPQSGFLSYAENLLSEFKIANCKTQNENLIFMQNKKGNIKLLIKKTENINIPAFSHNKNKEYILPVSPPPEFLKKLDFFTADGKIINNKYHKFRQINKYLEFIESVIPHFSISGKTLNIIDFGCEKAYLSFALCYYLTEIKHIHSRIHGLDIKKDVIEFCNKLAKDCNFSNLNFEIGDIKDFEFKNNPDMVISLHACDTATDFALAKAIKSNTKVIFAVPCCQHELNTQIRQNKQYIQKNTLFAPFLDYGIITEKFSSLLTDIIRAKFLESSGYKVSIEEFIDAEHTPKNILIKAIKIDNPNKKELEIIEKAKTEITGMKKAFCISPLLEKLLKS